jgi:hypothetical protein
MEKFVTDLGVSADDVITLVIAWHFGAETLGEFSKEEFENGMKKLRYGFNHPLWYLSSSHHSHFSFSFLKKKKPDAHR